jgi:restriction system protein
LDTERRIFGDRVDEIFREVFRGLKELGGRARPKQLFAQIEPHLRLTPYEREPLASGNIRWQTMVRWYSVDCSRAGFLEKSGGYWTLTPQGEAAMKLPPGELIRSASRSYREWKSQQALSEPEVVEAVEVVVEQEKVERQTDYEQAVETARAGIEEHIDSLGPYEFQNLVAELLRAMGYYVPHVAPPGPDGGIDIMAYRDPLGTVEPRIKVQVKHRQAKVGARDIRELEGLLRKEGDIGLLVSSGGFSSDAQREARSSHRHIELMDLDRLISLWQEHYGSLREMGRAMLRLVTVHFLAPAEE